MTETKPAWNHPFRRLQDVATQLSATGQADLAHIVQANAEALKSIKAADINTPENEFALRIFGFLKAECLEKLGSIPMGSSNHSIDLNYAFEVIESVLKGNAPHIKISSEDSAACVSCGSASQTSTPDGGDMCHECFGEFNAGMYDELKQLIDQKILEAESMINKALEYSDKFDLKSSILQAFIILKSYGESLGHNPVSSKPNSESSGTKNGAIVRAAFIAAIGLSTLTFSGISFASESVETSATAIVSGGVTVDFHSGQVCPNGLCQEQTVYIPETICEDPITGNWSSCPHHTIGGQD